MPGPLVDVEVFEEKGTDVNLATELVADGLLNDFDNAYVISNDSDLTNAIRLVRRHRRLPIDVLSPNPSVSRDLKRAASSYGYLDLRLVRQCQLPDTLEDATGQIHRPSKWLSRRSAQ